MGTTRRRHSSVACRPPSGSETAEVAALIENVSDRDQLVLPEFLAAGTVVVDGVLNPSKPYIYDGRAHVLVNEVVTRRLDFPNSAFDGASHQISFRVGSAVSNTITVQFPTRQ